MSFRSFALAFVPTVLGVLECTEHVPLTRFRKIKSCHRSTQRIIGAANFENLSDCVKYARTRKALAFNFSPITGSFSGRETGYASSCQLLGCPETGNASSLARDNTYDYYSVFAGKQNATCVKSVGLFLLNKQKLNYTEAIAFCQSVGGDLAHVVTEARTNALSALIAGEIQEWYKAAYVGLDDRKVEGRFETSLGAPLSCFKFRAWAPSHPRNKSRRDDCVILDHEKSWRVVKCKHRLASVCELYPGDDVVGDDVTVRPNCDQVTGRSKSTICCFNLVNAFVL